MMHKFEMNFRYDLQIDLTHLPKFWCTFRGLYINDPGVLVGVSGNGNTPDEAIQDYIQCLTGKNLVLEMDGKREYFIGNF